VVPARHLHAALELEPRPALGTSTRDATFWADLLAPLPNAVGEVALPEFLLRLVTVLDALRSPRRDRWPVSGGGGSPSGVTSLEVVVAHNPGAARLWGSPKPPGASPGSGRRRGRGGSARRCGRGRGRGQAEGDECRREQRVQAALEALGGVSDEVAAARPAAEPAAAVAAAAALEVCTRVPPRPGAAPPLWRANPGHRQTALQRLESESSRREALEAALRRSKQRRGEAEAALRAHLAGAFRHDISVPRGGSSPLSVGSPRAVFLPDAGERNTDSDSSDADSGPEVERPVLPPWSSKSP
jgi:hypothetical protein